MAAATSKMTECTQSVNSLMTSFASDENTADDLSCRSSASPILFWRRVSELIRFTLARQHRRVASTNSQSSPEAVPPEGKISSEIKMYCRLCLSERTLSDLVALESSCGHKFCADCLREMITLAIGESRVMIECPLLECSKYIHPSDITKIVGDDKSTLLKYEQFMVRRVLHSIPDVRWCPAPDCTYAVIAHGCASCPRLRCERCKTEFCYHCQQVWHPNKTCIDAASTNDRRSKRRPQCGRRRKNVPEKIDSPLEKQRIVLGETIKRCPRCKVAIMKVDDGSCNHMTCSQCGAEFCWLCLKVITDLHFLSPSGCTFWGRKRWSRKKKALWQCLALVGAPFGIAIAACISVPAIFVGLPVWAGRKAYKRLSLQSKRKRNIAVCLTSISALLAAPVVASVTVVVGVPVLLTYTYGVIPMSMCRGEGCIAFSGSSDDLLVENPEESILNFQRSEQRRRFNSLASVDSRHSSFLIKQNFKMANTMEPYATGQASLRSCYEACGAASKIASSFERSASETTFKRNTTDLNRKPRSSTLKSGYASLVGLLDNDTCSQFE